MKLTEAQSILREVDGSNYSWLKAWGLGWIKESIRTIRNRKSATREDHDIADRIESKISSRW